MRRGSEIKLRGILVDTNAVVAAIVEDHIHHTWARKLLEETKELYINHLVVSELSHVLHRLGVSAHVVRTLLTHPKVRLYSSNDSILLASNYLASKGLSLSNFVDVTLIYDSVLSELPLLTFDKRLAKRARELGAKVVEV